MAINRVDYGDETLIDLTQDTVTPQTLAAGYTAHSADGNQIQGQANFGSGGGTEKYIVEVNATLQEFMTLVSGAEVTIQLAAGTHSNAIAALNSGKICEIKINSPGELGTTSLICSISEVGSAILGNSTFRDDITFSGVKTLYNLSVILTSDNSLTAKLQNIESDIFWVNATDNSSDKTYSEIANAVSAGKVVKMRYSYYELNLAAVTTGLAMFSVTGVQDLSGTRMLVTIQITVDSSNTVTMTTDLIPVSTST